MLNSRLPRKAATNAVNTALLVLLIMVTSPAAYAQNSRLAGETVKKDLVQEPPKTQRYSEHMLGVRYGYALNGVHYNPNIKQKIVANPINASVLFTYYHDLWGTIKIFGLQTGFTYTHHAYEAYSTVHRYEVYRIPMVSQFHIDFWKARLLLNLGFYGGYRRSLLIENLPTEQSVASTERKEFDPMDRRWDFGIQGGGGLALHFHPFELQIEANYEYSLSMLYNPRKNSNESYIYVYPYALIFSAALFFHF